MPEERGDKHNFLSGKAAADKQVEMCIKIRPCVHGTSRFAKGGGGGGGQFEVKEGHPDFLNK